MLVFVPGSDVGLSHCVCSPIGDLAGGGGWFHPPWPHYGLSTNPQTHVGVQTGHRFIQWYTPTSGLGWMYPPPRCSHPRVAPGAPKLGLFSTACHISSPCPCCAVCASPRGARLEELVLGSLLGGGLLSPWPPSAPSSSAAAGPGSSTLSHPSTGNGASLASPSGSPWVRMFLEITVGTGNAGLGSTGVGWGELQLVPLP